jgi:hypothetical protein
MSEPDIDMPPHLMAKVTSTGAVRWTCHGCGVGELVVGGAGTLLHKAMLAMVARHERCVGAGEPIPVAPPDVRRRIIPQARVAR